jgi:predicted metal-dependent phosphoesterase TrpH
MAAKKIKIDPHIHSEGSYDSDSTVENIVEHVNDIDLDAAVITDHDSIEKSLEAVEIAKDYDDAIFVPGVEVSTADGHLLAIGVKECPEPGQPFMDTVEEVRRMGGLAVVPHPFQRSRHGVGKKKILDCDAIEIFNSSWVLTGLQNRRAEKFARRNGYAGIAGSDAHSTGMIGRAYTELEVETRFWRREPHPSDITAAMKGGYSSIQGKRSGVKHTVSNYAQYSAMKARHKSSDAINTVSTVLGNVF